MTDMTYHVSSAIAGRMLGHFPALQPLVRDKGEADNEEDLLLQARVRSGDYFMTLATELESIADSLAVADMPEAAELERITKELISLHKDYRIVGK